MTQISEKAQRVLILIFVIHLFILGKIWYLTVIQREERREVAKKPQSRTIVQQANRGSIHDRSHSPLAQNRICYHASLYYSQILQIPSVHYERLESGELQKSYPRKKYIEALSKCLSSELSLDPQYIEDLIHAKASLFPNTPYVLKENISEASYYRLKMLEREWTGLHAQISSERVYPHGKVASALLGYMGSISSNEYFSIAEEIKRLEAYLDAEDFLLTLPEGYSNRQEVYQQYKELKEKAYTINARIGKTGLEQQFEKALRGYYGKSSFAVDVKGTFLKELPGGQLPTPGQHIRLAISSELQEFAEKLLAQSEFQRDNRSIGYDPNTKRRATLKQPWIKGGAIVVLDPNTGEILTMASYPRFDPNDFVLPVDSSQQKQQGAKVNKWLETETHIGRIFDGQEPLARELYLPAKGFYEDTTELTWSKFLSFILPENHSMIQHLEGLNLRDAITLQEGFSSLLFFSGQTRADLLIDTLFPKDIKASKTPQEISFSPENFEEINHLIQKIRPFLKEYTYNADKLFFIDLCRIAVYSPGFSDELIQSIGHLQIKDYLDVRFSALRAQSTVKELIKDVFHKHDFASWREENQAEFLKEKRQQEAEKKTYARPYIDYLEQEELSMFASFWRKYGHMLTLYCLRGVETPDPSLDLYYEYLPQNVLPENKFTKLQKTLSAFSDSLATEYLKTFRKFSELDRALFGTYYRARGKAGQQLEKHLAAGFYPKNGFGYGKSHAFRQATPFGSTYKIAVAYEALRQNYRKNAPIFSFKMIDRVFWDSRIGKKGSLVVGYTLDHKPYTRFYKGGRLPKSAHTNMGEIDLMAALEQSSNPYFSILAGDYLQNPEEDLIEVSKNFGFGEKTGIDLPGEYKGNLPRDLKRNRTGIYSFAIGQHSLLVTPLQSAIFSASLANFGALLKPQILKEIYGQTPQFSSELVYDPHEFTYRDVYRKIGLNFPLFSRTENHKKRCENISFDIDVKRWIFLPQEIRNPIFEGLDRVVSGSKGTARPSIIKELYGNPILSSQYKALQHQMIGKTSTAEILHNPDLLPSSRAKMYKHVWFNALSFKEGSKLAKDRWSNPELVIAVYLRFGDSGKAGAPIAAQLIHKWREISAHSDN